MAVDADDAVASAVRKEIGEGKLVLERLERRLEEFEEEYEMDTDEFVEKFESGELGDDEDFFEWFAVHQEAEHLREKTNKLQEAV